MKIYTLLALVAISFLASCANKPSVEDAFKCDKELREAFMVFYEYDENYKAENTYQYAQNALKKVKAVQAIDSPSEKYKAAMIAFLTLEISNEENYKRVEELNEIINKIYREEGTIEIQNTTSPKDTQANTIADTVKNIATAETDKREAKYEAMAKNAEPYQSEIDEIYEQYNSKSQPLITAIIEAQKFFAEAYKVEFKPVEVYGGMGYGEED